MSETDINATVNVTEDIYADVDSTAMSAAVIDDGDSIVVPAEVDFGHTLDTELEDNDLIDVPVDESVGIAGDHRVLIHRDAPNQHPMSSITGLNDALAGINTALSSRISQVEAETADLDVDMADALLRIGDLQDQVDGNITTWFYAAEPAMNLPPVAYDPSNPHDTGWDTDDKKNAHKGDLYYNTLTGYAYRFAYSDGAYGWMRITDTDVVKALADAAKAQDTADSKRRVFYTTPYPPYDKGDLWVQGGSGDILVCTTDKPADGSYSESDWSRASKYTDDTVADIALASANGKNTVYHQASQPTGGTYKKGDTWFDTDDDYTMYTYDGSLWIKEQFGNEAIADMSITNAKIANATIEYGKIKSVDAGKITVGDLAADRIKASVITAVNGSTETSGGSSLKISADKVNIQGVITAINNDTTTTIDGDKITTGTLSASAVDATSGTFNTANIPNLDAAKITSGYIDAARIEAGSIGVGKIDATSGTFNEANIPNLNANKITAGTLDADRIGAGSIAVGKIDATSGTFNTANIPNLNASKITAGDISADRLKVNAISAINSNTGSVQISANKVDIAGAAVFNNYSTTTEMNMAIGNAVDGIEVGGRNLLQQPISDFGATLNGLTLTYDSVNKKYTITGTNTKTDVNWTLRSVFRSLEVYLDTDSEYTLTSYGNMPSTLYVQINAYRKDSGTPFGLITLIGNGNTVSGSFTPPDYYDETRPLEHVFIGVKTETRAVNCSFQIKLEKGNKSTDWTPAPEDVQAEIDAKKSVHTLSTSYSWNYSAILGYAAEGTSTNFNVTSTSGVLVGDTVRLKVAVHDMNEAPVYIVGTVTNINSNGVTLTITAHGLDTTVIDGGNILTNSIGANKIKVEEITIGAAQIGSGTIDTARIPDLSADKITSGTINIGRIPADALNSNIQVGGKNLVRAPSSSTVTINGLTFTYNPDNGYITVTGTNTKTDAAYVAYHFSKSESNLKVTANQQYTYTIEGNMPSVLYAQINGLNTSGNAYGVFRTEGTGGTVSKIITVPSNHNSSAALNSFFIGVMPSARAVSCSFRIKLESGNKKTAWTPAPEDLDNYITRIDNNGIRVHPYSTQNNSAVINASGMEVFKGGTTDAYSVAKYGDTARVGKASTRHIEVKDGGMQVYQDASVVMAHIGYGNGASESGTASAPYFTFGTRASGSVGNYSLTEGTGNLASAPMSHAEGKNTTASGNMSHAEGAGTVASSYEAHAEGHNTTASAQMTHAEGNGTTASKDYAHAEGNGTTASGIASHAEGNSTTASGNYSHAEGDSTTASGYASHASGRGTWARGEAQTVVGKYNATDTTSLFIVGKGTGSADSARSNAFAVSNTGQVFVNGTSVHSSDRRLKEHIAYLDQEVSVDFIDSLKPAYYIKDGEHHVGFYAQDVEEADKWQCMVGEMNGYKTLCYIELIAPLVTYCQKLEKRIEELERSK